MTVTTWIESRLECPRCGNRYLPPWREGLFCCSVCGARLPARARRRMARRGAAGLLLLVGLIGVASLLVGARLNRPVIVARAYTASSTMDWPWSEEDQRRTMEARRAANQRALRHEPDASAPHAAVARDLYQRARSMAEERMEPETGEMMGLEGMWLQRRRRGLQRERIIATSLANVVRPGLQQAETALRLAKSASEELEARRARAQGLLYLGEYRRAMAEYAWLDSVEPGQDSMFYARCYDHLGLQLPERLEKALRMPFMPGPDWSREENLKQIERAHKAAGQWTRRWRRDSALQMQLGALTFLLASERAALREDFPRPARDGGERIDAFIYRHQGALVRQGLEYYRRALARAEEPWQRSRALEELARGYLIAGRPEVAITHLKRALTADPDLQQAGYYLRSAFRRTARLRGPLRRTDGQESYGPASSGGIAVGMMLSGVPRLPTQRRRLPPSMVVREAGRLLEALEETESRRDAATREKHQEALNRLDEILGGCAVGYDPTTFDVLRVDRRWVQRRMDQQIQSMDSGGGYYAPGPIAYGPPMGGGPGPGYGPAFRP